MEMLELGLTDAIPILVVTALSATLFQLIQDLISLCWIRIQSHNAHIIEYFMTMTRVIGRKEL